MFKAGGDGGFVVRGSLMGGRRPGGNNGISKDLVEPFVRPNISCCREEKFEEEGGPVIDRAGGGGRTDEGCTKVLVEGCSCRSNGS
jgi:hypothetical protein